MLLGVPMLIRRGLWPGRRAGQCFSGTTRNKNRFIHVSIMTTTNKIVIGKENTGVLGVRQSEEAARELSELLQQDFDTHHVFFNSSGFHNHISHQLLALYGSGASVDQLDIAYKDNASYQKPLTTFDENIVRILDDWPEAKKYMGNGKHYPDFLEYYLRKIDEQGIDATLNEVFFAKTERSEMMFYLLFTGIFHPLIQLMYALEWRQPALLSMALAQAAVHSSKYTPFLKTIDSLLSASHPNITLEEALRKAGPLLAQVYNSTPIATAANGNNYFVYLHTLHDDHPDLLRQIIALIPDVTDDTLAERTAELYYMAVLFAVAPAMKVANDFGKVPRICFHAMHHATSMPVHVTVNGMAQIPEEFKKRMIRLRMAGLVVEYGARLLPPVGLEAVRGYVPRDGLLEIDDALKKVTKVKDDGHSIKLARSLAILRGQCLKYAESRWMKLADDDFSRIAGAIVDTTTTPSSGPSLWARSGGYLMNFRNVESAEWITPKKQFEQWWSSGTHDKLTWESGHTIDPDLVKQHINDLKARYGKWPVDVTRDWFI